MIKVGVIPEINEQRIPTPCAYIRLILPFTQIERRSAIEFEFFDIDSLPAYRPDVVVFHRISLRTSAAIERVLAYCRTHHASLIYDLDDDLAAIDQSHPDFESYADTAPAVRLAAACADQMWVSTTVLAERYGGLAKHIVVVPNTLDPRVWRLSPPDAPSGTLRFMYMGTRSHKDDFHKLVAPAFERLKNNLQSKVELDVIGVLDAPSPRSAWQTVAVPGRFAGSYPAFATWLQAQRGYAVGLAPLIDNSFNLAKSNIKAIEYSALGLATIAADLAPYQNGGLAMLARPTAEDFHDAMLELATDHDALTTLQQKSCERISKLVTSWAAADQRAALLEQLVGREGVQPSSARRAVPQREANEHHHHQLNCEISELSTTGRLRLVGWAVSGAGIERIRILFDSKPVGDATFGAERPDVGQCFPTIAGAQRSGFSFEGTVEAGNIDNKHSIAIEIVPLIGDAIPFTITVFRQDQINPAVSSAGIDLIVRVDEPIRVSGAAVRPITGAVSIVGWALAEAGIKGVTVELDDVVVGNAYVGLRRPDVARAFANRQAALFSGFEFSLARQKLTEGRHSVSVNVLSNHLKEEKVKFSIEVASGEEEDKRPWRLRRRLGLAEQRLAASLIACLRHKAQFVVWLHCAGAPAEPIRATLLSLQQQIFHNWKVVLVGAPAAANAEIVAGELAATASLLGEFSEDTPPAGSPGADSDSVWIMPLAAGDILSIDALMEFALLASQEPSSDLLYADERRFNPASRRVEAFLKPQWSPELLWSTNYIGRPWCARPAVLERAAVSARTFMDFGHYDLVLHSAAQARRIVHVPQVLCERRPDEIEPRDTEMQALRRAHVQVCGEVAVETGRIDGTYRVMRKEAPKGRVSVIVPTCAAGGLIKTCIESLRSLTTYSDIEIICIDNILDTTSYWKPWLRRHADIVVEVLEPFNWSRFNNIAVRHASGVFLLFLNDDTQIVQPDWLEPLLDLASRPEIGVVGPQLLYPDGKLQSAGMFLAGPSTARHAFRYADANEPGYHGLAQTQRNVIAVTGACMLMRTEVFQRLDGFVESHAVINNDLDFCLKAHDAGLRNVYTPFSRLIHHELASRAQMNDDHDTSAFAARWSAVVASGDPYFHRHLSRLSDDYRCDEESVCTLIASHPLFSAIDIKRILVVKVDHIGDFLIALPAFQRIKQVFPQSKLYVLASPASQQLAGLEPCIDEVISFEFFHARSGDGQKLLGEREREALTARLKSLDIDIAIDLRKHPETRPLLQLAGAKWTAGFDYRNRFPWLDIALTWEGDEWLTAKRNHVAIDLVNLVDTVAAAGRPSCDPIRRSSAWSLRQIAVASQLSSEGFYDRPMVCMHPASGNEMRQWPPQYFAQLADALVETEDVNIVLIGTPDEQDIADRMLSNVTRKERVISLIGSLTLEQLPYFIDTCALFVGNDSGPKHIAAALGVPTVGIHSGVADSREFGPLGDAAVAIRRNMTCSPCYFSKREDCDRGLACLIGLSAADVLPLCRRLLGVGRVMRSSAAG